MSVNSRVNGMQPLSLMVAAPCSEGITIRVFYQLGILKKGATLHAEIHVIHQCTKRLIKQQKSLKKYSILVVRIKRDTGELVNSKPCHDCIKAMRKCGIKKVYYSNDQGEIVMERVNNIENRCSTGFRNLNI
jgi:deoxycytidylate deaminase